ncbi:MAG: ABC transporter permease subunit [Zavarzinella sp.]
MNVRSHTWQLFPGTAFLLLFLAGPLLLLVRMSLYHHGAGRSYYQPGTWTVENYRAVLSTFHLEQLLFTILFATAIATVSVGIGLTLALFIRTRSPRGQVLAISMLILPKLANVLVLVFGFQQFLSETQILNRIVRIFSEIDRDFSRGLIAALMAEVLFVAPMLALIVFSQVRRFDRTLEVAALGLGASSWQVFWRIVFPQTVPVLVISSQLGFLWGMGAFLGPLFLGQPENYPLGVEIYRQAFEYNRWPLAATLATIQTIAAVGILVGSHFVFRVLWGKK